MKMHLAILIWCSVTVSTFAQSPYIVDDAIAGGYILPFQDTLLNSYGEWGCSTQNYFIDLDGDSIADVDFYFRCYLGGFGSYFDIAVSGSGNFRVIADTAFLSPVSYFDSTGSIKDSLVPFTVTEQFHSGDTISLGLPSRPEQTTILSVSIGNFPTIIYYLNIDHFIGDTCSIAFYKEEQSETWIYCLKVLVENRYRIRLLSARTNDKKLAIGDIGIPSFRIYPNPASSRVIIEGDAVKASVYSLGGTMMRSSVSLGGKEIAFDISGLPAGLYLVRIDRAGKAPRWEKLAIAR